MRSLSAEMVRSRQRGGGGLPPRGPAREPGTMRTRRRLPCPRRRFARWFPTACISLDEKEGERGHGTCHAGAFFKAAGAAAAATMAFELSSQSGGVRGRAVFRLEAREHRGVHEHLLLLLGRVRGHLLDARRRADQPRRRTPIIPSNQGGLCPKGATMFQLRNVG